MQKLASWIALAPDANQTLKDIQCISQDILLTDRHAHTDTVQIIMTNVLTVRDKSCTINSWRNLYFCCTCWINVVFLFAGGVQPSCGESGLNGWWGHQRAPSAGQSRDGEIPSEQRALQQPEEGEGVCFLPRCALWGVDSKSTQLLCFLRCAAAAESSFLFSPGRLRAYCVKGTRQRSLDLLGGFEFTSAVKETFKSVLKDWCFSFFTL